MSKNNAFPDLLALSDHFKSNPELGKKPINETPVLQVNKPIKKEQEVPDKFKGKTYLQLFDADLLEECKNDFPELFEQLKKEHKNKKK